jgi:hypothetical protein
MSRSSDSNVGGKESPMDFIFSADNTQFDLFAFVLSSLTLIKDQLGLLILYFFSSVTTHSAVTGSGLTTLYKPWLMVPSLILFINLTMNSLKSVIDVIELFSLMSES